MVRTYLFPVVVRTAAVAEIVYRMDVFEISKTCEPTHLAIMLHHDKRRGPRND